MSSKPLLILKIAISFTFIYAAVSGFLHPADWIGYFPAWIPTFGFSLEAILKIWGILEIILAVLILFGIYLSAASLIAAILLLGLVATNPSQIDILFRDIGLALAAIALFMESLTMSKQKNVS